MSTETKPPRDLELAERMHGVRSSAIRDLLAHAQRPGMISFAGGLPAAETFDLDGIRDATMAALEQRASLQYGATEGEQSLREMLARGMRAEGMAAHADDLLVTTGSQQALDLVARLLLNPQDTVLVERPTYLAALQVFALAQARPLGVETDRDGLCVERLDDALAQAAARGWRRPRLLYVVPDFGNPGGAMMSRARRIALLRWALEREVMVLEDAPYSALHFGAPAGPSLYALAAQLPGAAQQLIFQSTLSKTIAPALRIGWLAMSAPLRDAAVRIKQALDLHTSTLTQRIAVNYLASGRLDAHLETVRSHYRIRCQTLAAELARVFGERLELSQPAGGMFIWARFRDGTDSLALLARALEHGVMFVPGSDFYSESPDPASLRLAFPTVDPVRIVQGVERLAQAHASLARA